MDVRYQCNKALQHSKLESHRDAVAGLSADFTAAARVAPALALALAAAAASAALADLAALLCIAVFQRSTIVERARYRYSIHRVIRYSVQ